MKDVTGKAIEKALLRSVETNPLIETLEHYFAVELITVDKLKQNNQDISETNRVVGLFAFNINNNR